jgi:hypothetical protein
MGEEAEIMRRGGQKKFVRKEQVARIYHLHSSESVNLQKAQAYLEHLSSSKEKIERVLDEMERGRRKWRE